MINVKKAMPAPFDLERAKRGDEVITRDGRDVRIICFDRKNVSNYPIIALVEEEDGSETILLYTSRGELSMGVITAADFFMKPKHHFAYINIFRDKVNGVTYSMFNKDLSEEINNECIRSNKDEYLGTTTFEWDE